MDYEFKPLRYHLIACVILDLLCKKFFIYYEKYIGINFYLINLRKYTLLILYQNNIYFFIAFVIYTYTYFILYILLMN